MGQAFRELLFSHHPPLVLSLLSILLPCTFCKDDRAGLCWGSKGGFLVLWIPCHWEAAQRSCCSSSLSWQPCLNIWICFIKVRRSYHWIQLQFPQPLMLSCEVQDFLNWSWSLMISGIGSRKESSPRTSPFSSLSHVSGWTSKFLVFVSHEVLTMQPSWAALGVTRMPQTNSDEEQGEPPHCVSSELNNFLGVTEREFYDEKLKGCAPLPT